MEDSQQAQKKKDGKNSQKPWMLQRGGLLKIHPHRFLTHEPDAKKKQNKAYGSEGQHGEKKLPHSQPISGTEKKVLGISGGSSHTSQIGSYGLQHNDRRSMPVLFDNMQYQDGEGNKGEERHIICDHHGTEKRQ